MVICVYHHVSGNKKSVFQMHCPDDINDQVIFLEDLSNFERNGLAEWKGGVCKRGVLKGLSATQEGKGV